MPLLYTTFDGHDIPQEKKKKPGKNIPILIHHYPNPEKKLYTRNVKNSPN